MKRDGNQFIFDADEHVLLLVHVERNDEVAKDRLEVRHEQRTGVLFKGRKSTAARLLDALVLVEDHAQQTFHGGHKVLLQVLRRRAEDAMDDLGHMTAEEGAVLALIRRGLSRPA